MFNDKRRGVPEEVEGEAGVRGEALLEVPEGNVQSRKERRE